MREKRYQMMTQRCRTRDSIGSARLSRPAALPSIVARCMVQSAKMVASRSAGLGSHSTVTARSQHGHSAVTARSQHGRQENGAPIQHIQHRAMEQLRTS